MTTHTAEDFAAVPWGGMAIHEAEQMRDKAVHTAQKRRDKLIQHIASLEATIRRRNAEIDDLKANQMPEEGVVVTTAREALDAAWNLAHEPENGVVPMGSEYIFRNHEGTSTGLRTAEIDLECGDASSRRQRRLLDPPTQKPEPWETSPYVIVTGDNGKPMIAERWGNHWVFPGNTPRIDRDEIAAMNPQPLDPKEMQG